MTNTERRYTSRSNRPKKPNRMNKILNALIGLVVVLIVITAGIIFFGDDESEQANSKNETEETASELEDTENVEEPETTSDEIGSEEIASEDESTEESTESTTEEDGSVTTLPSEDEVVSESIDNSAWEPIGTSQTGEHTSVYTEGHIDWDEKVKALAYATGLSSDNMIVWRIENGGGPQKSIGVVSSNDKEEKYRVHLQWIDQEGWKPEKLETLKTLNGAY